MNPDGPMTFRSLKKPSSFRKLAAVSWGAQNDPAIYGVVEVDATNAAAYIKKLSSKKDGKVTYTHLVIRAIARAFAKYPDLNAKVRWGKVKVRDRVDVFVQVATDGGKDLSGALITNADQKSLLEIAQLLSGKAEAIRTDEDPTFKKSRGIISFIPGLFLGPFIRFTDWLVNTLHFHLPGSGMPRDPFGSAMVTNVGPFGADFAFAPIPTFSRCPIVLLLTEVKDRPWVVDGKVKVRPVLRICATLDHRILDGYSAGLIQMAVQSYLEDPKNEENETEE